jgi:flagellar motor switch protein FliM
MSSPASPAETRAYIIERLVGETGEPDRVVEAARALAERAIPTLLAPLNEMLGAPVGVKIRNVALARFANACPQEASNHAMTIAASDSSPDALMLLIDPEGLAVIVSALFGGDPDLPTSPIARALSPTEIIVAEMVFKMAAEAINGSGERAFNLRFPLLPPITGAELAKHVARDGPAVRIDYSIFSGPSSGLLSLLVPQRVFLKHRGDTVAAKPGDKQAPADWGARFGEEVMRSSVKLEAVMPLSRLTLGEIADFHEGQVIEIDATAQSAALLSARKKTLFVCEFGKLGQNYTVRVRHPFDAGQDIMEGLVASR